MSKRTRRNFSAEVKAKVCIEAIKEQKTIAELSAEYEVHPNVIRTWKKEFLERSAEIFKDGKTDTSATQKKEEELYKQIGQMKVEMDWLKKKLSPLGMI